jgi:hypothetical protein
MIRPVHVLAVMAATIAGLAHVQAAAEVDDAAKCASAKKQLERYWAEATPVEQKIKAVEEKHGMHRINKEYESAKIEVARKHASVIQNARGPAQEAAYRDLAAANEALDQKYKPSYKAARKLAYAENEGHRAELERMREPYKPAFEAQSRHCSGFH